MTSIPFLTEAIYCNNFRCNHLRNKKHFLNFFFAFSQFRFNFEYFQKKKMILIADVSFKLRSGNTWLDKCPKTHVSEDLLTSYLAHGLKHCWILDGSTFTIFIDPCEGNSGLKSLSEWYAKSWDCFLIQSLAIISFLFLTEGIYCNIYRCNYHRNEKHFLNFFFFFFLCFLQFRFNFERFQKKEDFQNWCIFELTAS